MRKSLNASSIQLGSALLSVVLALTGFANADSIHQNAAHKAKSGHLTIAEPTEVGGVLLPAGDYTVKEVNSPNGKAMEFTRTFRNELGSELVSPYDDEVVARVEFTAEALNSAPKHTQLFLAEDGKNATALEIRGDNADYVFASPQMAVRSGTPVVCVNDGAQ